MSSTATARRSVPTLASVRRAREMSPAFRELPEEVQSYYDYLFEMDNPAVPHGTEIFVGDEAKPKRHLLVFRTGLRRPDEWVETQAGWKRKGA
jgi:hypothetical protein